jgi:hypothetical protein
VSLLIFINFISFSAFAMGRAFVMGSSALGMGALCFYGMGLSHQTGALEKSAYVCVCI